MANKTMFYAGIILVAIAVILLLGNFTGDSISPMVLGIIGIVSISASKYRLLKNKKH